MFTQNKLTVTAVVEPKPEELGEDEENDVQTSGLGHQAATH